VVLLVRVLEEEVETVVLELWAMQVELGVPVVLVRAVLVAEVVMVVQRLEPELVGLEVRVELVVLVVLVVMDNQEVMAMVWLVLMV